MPQAIDYTESEEDIGGRSLFRFANGDEAVQAYWTRKKVIMSGSGLLPPGLDGIDWTKPQIVEGTLFEPFEALIKINTSDQRFGKNNWSVEAVET